MSACRHQRSARDLCTKHAHTRMQQRCIRQRGVDAAIDYGSEHRTDDGYIYHLSKRVCRRLQRTLPPAEAREIMQLIDIYAVVSDDGQIITVGHRTRRIRR